MIPKTVLSGTAIPVAISVILKAWIVFGSVSACRAAEASCAKVS